MARHLHEAIGLKIDDVNQHMYVSDLGGSIYRHGLEGGEPVKLFNGQGVYTGIALAHLEKSQAMKLYVFEA